MQNSWLLVVVSVVVVLVLLFNKNGQTPSAVSGGKEEPSCHEKAIECDSQGDGKCKLYNSEDCKECYAENLGKQGLCDRCDAECKTSIKTETCAPFGDLEVDCAGVCRGTAQVDECGVCNGDNSCLCDEWKDGVGAFEKAKECGDPCGYWAAPCACETNDGFKTVGWTHKLGGDAVLVENQATGFYYENKLIGLDIDEAWDETGNKIDPPYPYTSCGVINPETPPFACPHQFTLKSTGDKKYTTNGEKAVHWTQANFTGRVPPDDRYALNLPVCRSFPGGEELP